MCTAASRAGVMAIFSRITGSFIVRLVCIVVESPPRRSVNNAASRGSNEITIGTDEREKKNGAKSVVEACECAIWV